MLCVCYVYHKSIIAYIVQQYHRASDMILFEDSLFSIGDSIAQNLENVRVSLFETNAPLSFESLESETFAKEKEHIAIHLSTQENTQQNAPNNQNTERENENEARHEILQESKENNDAQNAPIIELETSTQKNDGFLYVEKGTRFLLIGDSLMQGIAMALPRMLQERGFLAKSIAKQSTGLTYPSFFNWERALKQAFLQYSDIGVVVVCLGANDPWNMPKMRFQSSEWEDTYKARIQAIIDTAKAHNAMIIWYALPKTKNADFTKKLLYLNGLYEEIVSANNGIFLEASAILDNGEYSTYLKDSEGKSHLVRAQDGIHFSRYGAKLLAQTLLDRIKLQDEKDSITTQENMPEQESKKEKDFHAAQNHTEVLQKESPLDTTTTQITNETSTKEHYKEWQPKEAIKINETNRASENTSHFFGIQKSND